MEELQKINNFLPAAVLVAVVGVASSALVAVAEPEGYGKAEWVELLEQGRWLEFEQPLVGALEVGLWR